MIRAREYHNRLLAFDKSTYLGSAHVLNLTADGRSPEVTECGVASVVTSRTATTTEIGEHCLGRGMVCAADVTECAAQS